MDDPTSQSTPTPNPDILGVLQPDEWSALWGFLTLVVAAVAAVIALLQLSTYVRERSEAARPYIVVDYRFHSILMAVEVSNPSGAVATDVKLRVDPPFDSTEAEKVTVFRKVFSDAYSIRQLAPGRSIQWTLDRAPDYIKAKKPGNYTVTVTFSDPRAFHRRWWKFWTPKLPKSYTELFDLNIDQWSEARADTDYDNMNWNIADRNEKRLERIAKSLEKLASK